jgi:hypothetical protein
LNLENLSQGEFIPFLHLENSCLGEYIPWRYYARFAFGDSYLGEFILCLFREFIPWRIHTIVAFGEFIPWRIHTVFITLMTKIFINYSSYRLAFGE